MRSNFIRKRFSLCGCTPTVIDISIVYIFLFNHLKFYNSILMFKLLNNILYIYISLIGWKESIKSNKLNRNRKFRRDRVEEGWRIWCVFCRKVKHRYRFYRRWNYGWPETAIRALHRFSNKFKKVSPEFSNSPWSFSNRKDFASISWN